MEGASNFFITRGAGSPEGVVTASPGSLYMDITGFLYVKASGVGNTGWQTATLGSLAWGSITGTLSNQTDLQNALDAKAPANAHYVTTQSESGLSNEFNLGSLTGGLLKQTVLAGVSTPAIATEGSDYLAGNRIKDLPFSALYWNGVSEFTPSMGSVYTWGHTFDTNDNGKVNVLDIGAGIVKTDSGGIVSVATPDSDYTANSFKTISVSGQSDVVADSAADTLTLAAGTNVTLTTDASTDTVTISVAATPTATATATPTATATSTPTPTPTATATPTPTPTGTGLALEDSNGVFQSLVTTSAGVASAITDETGTAGSLVFSTSPALSGTPSSTNLAITGTAGAGYLTMVAQASNPSAPAAGTLLLHSATTQGFTRMEQDNEATTNLVYGRDNVFIAKNTTAGTITKGQVVYNTTTSTGAVPNIALAKADSVTTLPALGVALDDIAANAFGQIMVMGVVDSFNTNSFSTGDELYVSPTTAGAIQASIPTGVGQFSQRVGSVLNKGVGNGSMLIDIAPFVAPVQVLMKSVTFVVDGAGIVLTTGTKNPVKIPFGGTLAGWTIEAKPSGSVTLDIYRSADGAGLPVTSIVGGTGTKPSITTNTENSGTNFTNWTSTTLVAKDNLAINVDSATTVTYVALTLYYK